MASPRKLRELGCLESYLYQIHHNRLYSGVGVSATYRPPSSVNLAASNLRDVLYTALAAVVATHPALSACVIHDRKRVRYAQLPKVDLARLVHVRRPGTDLDQVLSEEHSTLFDLDAEAPLWRLVVVPAPPGEEDKIGEFTACFVYAHVIGDGISGLAFHRAFHAALPTRAPASQVSSIAPVQDQPFPPSLEQAFKLSITLPGLVHAVWTNLLRSPPATLWTGKLSSSQPPKTRFTSRAFSAAQTASLIARCGEENVTITALLQVAVGDAFFSAFTDGERMRYTGVPYQTPISVRRYVDGLTDDLIGVWSTTTNFLHTPSTEPIFSRARKRRAEMVARIEGSCKDTDAAYLRVLPDMESFVMSKVGRPRGTGFILSNIGAYEPPKTGEGKSEAWICEKVTFSQGTCPARAPVCVHVVSRSGGELVLGFVREEGMEEDLVDRVVEAVVEKVEKIARGDAG